MITVSTYAPELKVISSCIPKPPQDADSEFRADARARRNMMRMVFPFQVL